MSNKYAGKVKQRKEKIREEKLQDDFIPSDNSWFWVVAIALIFIIALLSYLAYTSNLVNELIIPIILLILILLLSIIWYLPKFYTHSLHLKITNPFDHRKELLKLEDDTRKTFAQITGGAILLSGLVLTYNTFRLQQEGQFTDRFTKSVEQLGQSQDEKITVRLGGMYALERIAKDSPKDHWTIMEILSAFVREKAKKGKSIVKDGIDNSNSSSNVSKNSNNINSNTKNPFNRILNINESNKINESLKIGIDVQTALTIIGRRKVEYDSKTEKINLTDLNLSFAILNGTNLIKVNFARSDLGSSQLNSANLSYSDLSEAILSNAKLIKANLSNTYLYKTIFRGTTDRTNLSEGILIGAYLVEADLTGANLTNADLTGADLNGAILNGVDFSNANLTNTRNISFEQISKATINEATKLPTYLEANKIELLQISKKTRETNK